jgi:hypothetical protein
MTPLFTLYNVGELLWENNRYSSITGRAHGNNTTGNLGIETWFKRW